MAISAGSVIEAKNLYKSRCTINLIGTGQTDSLAKSNSSFTISGNLPVLILYRLGTTTTGGMAVCGYSSGWKIRSIFSNSSSALNITSSGTTITIANTAASTHMYCLVCACGEIQFTSDFEASRSGALDMRYASQGRVITANNFGWLSKNGNTAAGSGQTWTGTLPTNQPRLSIWYFTENGAGTIASIGQIHFISSSNTWNAGRIYASNSSTSPTVSVSGNTLTITNKNSNSCHITFIGGM